MPLILPGRALHNVKSLRLRGPLDVCALSGRLIAVQVRDPQAEPVFGQGTLKVVDWVQTSEVIAPEVPGEALAAFPQAGREVSVRLEPSIDGLVGTMLRIPRKIFSFLLIMIVLLGSCCTSCAFLTRLGRRIPGNSHRILFLATLYNRPIALSLPNSHLQMAMANQFNGSFGARVMGTRSESGIL